MNTQTALLVELLARAQKTPGWNLRTDLPCSAEIAGGCTLHVVPAWLWQPRVRPRLCRFDNATVNLRKVPRRA